MTHLIDINLEMKPKKQSSFNFIRHSTRSSFNYSASQPKESLYSKQDNWSFIYETEQFQFNLLFSVCTRNSSLNINCYLLNENLQIYKINSLSERVLLINSFIKHKNSFQPKIDPSTGFIYFKVSFFDYKRWKGGGRFSIQNRSNDILKQFDLQKLMKSAQKLSESGLKMEDQHLTSSVWNDQKTYLQLSKFVSKLSKNNDLQQILTQKINQHKTNLIKKAANSQFVKSINHFTSSKPPREIFISPLRLQNFLTSLSHDYNELSALVKRKAGRSNYDSLLINQSTNKKLNQLMTNLVYRRESSSKQTLKILEAQMGKISVQMERQEQKRYQYKTSLLKLLPKNTEYHFLDKYFRSGLNIPIILRLSLKDESLARFLQNNKKTISLETKMRLMLQLYSAVTILWEQNRIILYVNKLNNIFVTKNLTIKLRGLQDWYRPQHHVLLEQKQQVNTKVVQNLMNLTKFYYKIFHQHQLIYVRPSSLSKIQLNLMQYCRKQRPLQNLRHPSIMQQGFNGKGLKHFFTGLGYFFSENIQSTRKIIENQKNTFEQIQTFVVTKDQTDLIETQHTKQKQTSPINSQKLLNLKHSCSWLFKILQAITKEIQ